MIDALTPGTAVDAACGTGRHAAYLAARGHRVIGVDGSPAMLARARARVPAADFRQGALDALPVETGSADLVVCTLALTHVADLRRPVAEMARVLRPGGVLIVSDLNPAMAMIGGTGLLHRRRRTGREREDGLAPPRRLRARLPRRRSRHRRLRGAAARKRICSP